LKLSSPLFTPDAGRKAHVWLPSPGSRLVFGTEFREANQPQGSIAFTAGFDPDFCKFWGEAEYDPSLASLNHHRRCPHVNHQGKGIFSGCPLSLEPAPQESSGFLRVTSPPAHKVVNTRYRIVKRTAAAPSGAAASFGSPALGWKSRRLSASRSLVLNRTHPSPPGSKSPALPQQQRWRSKGLRCIGGVMYRVSANKLAKTSSSPARGSELTSRMQARTARLDFAHSSPGYTPPGCPSRSATSRYIASRAVQRSLAIIRQAKQKKEKKKEYCMYYNRFGKCNRGENCPYIHDPEKVAVCTRFLRGTCKKTDGTCPFSHKVSKDKMPVCSYFLKGICSNSDCPYSHVYVSRKAEVCPDFLKGYCPLGEKCKKKHTLVCPDFSKNGVCPKGSQCKLQHLRRKGRAWQTSPGDPCQHECSAPKQARLAEQRTGTEEEPPGPSCAEPEGGVWSRRAPSQTSKLSKLPSFISLQSPSTSPAEEERKPERDKPREEAGFPFLLNKPLGQREVTDPALRPVDCGAAAARQRPSIRLVVANFGKDPLPKSGVAGYGFSTP
ncbi:PREDICTED: zinc finger CCCH domain-containing protein 3, partial [Gekko japonicus]|uniref:Zinc finger CCCH domain-containing protein 3 n=1 Tax=Gekko japonicus TaxID=146911 RepID=A0ABM1KIQ5_GEKJA